MDISNINICHKPPVRALDYERKKNMELSMTKDVRVYYLNLFLDLLIPIKVGEHWLLLLCQFKKLKPTMLIFEECNINPEQEIVKDVGILI